MQKSDLQDLLRTINLQYWNKMSEVINKVDFLNAWYEALKDYDYELIKYIYGQYNDTQFPPTAKYFTVFSDQMIATVTEEIRLATNEIWVWSTDEYAVTRAILTEYIERVPWKDKLEVLNRLKREFVMATREEKISIKDWINER